MECMDPSRYSQIHELITHLIHQVLHEECHYSDPYSLKIHASAIKTVGPSLSQYECHHNKLHSDYDKSFMGKSDWTSLPMSFILALDGFEFMYLPGIDKHRADIETINLKEGEAAMFTSRCLHSGGALKEEATRIRLFAYALPQHCYWNYSCSYSQNRGQL